MQALTAEFFCFAEEFRCFLQRRIKDSLFRSISFKSGSLTAAQRLLKSYLARNTRVAATFARFLRASACQAAERALPLPSPGVRR